MDPNSGLDLGVLARLWGPVLTMDPEAGVMQGV